MDCSIPNLETDGHAKEDLYWYAQWRPKIWAKIIGNTLAKIDWDNLQGKTVLEIGYGQGRMAVMFARHGARYLGYELNDRGRIKAQETAK